METPPPLEVVGVVPGIRHDFTDGVQLTLAGLALGLLLALAVGRLLGSMLYQIDSADPLVFGVSATLLAASALFAAWIPVRRACRIQPTEALRHE